MQQVFPWARPPESSTQTASRSLQPLLQGSLGNRPTDRPTDHAIRVLTIGGAHSGKPNSVIIYGYKYLLEQSTRHIGSTSAAIFSCKTRLRSPQRDMQNNFLSRAHELLSGGNEMLSRSHETNFFCMSLCGLRSKPCLWLNSNSSSFYVSDFHQAKSTFSSFKTGCC